MKKIIWIVVFGIAFGLVEAVIVIYLRMNYYPEGFTFPLKLIPERVLLIEVIREAATVVMLTSFGILVGKTGITRFGAFLMTFGVWDIFYYVWLKIFINWPASLMDWDILYLIPVPWIAPVLAPILVSAGLITCGGWIIFQEDRGAPIKTKSVDWAVESIAGALIVASFIVNYDSSVPDVYPWWLFFIGLVGGVGYFIWRATHRRESDS